LNASTDPVEPPSNQRLLEIRAKAIRDTALLESIRKWERGMLWSGRVLAVPCLAMGMWAASMISLDHSAATSAFQAFAVVFNAWCTAKAVMAAEKRWSEYLWLLKTIAEVREHVEHGLKEMSR
jgi:hypothetical protein